MEWLTQNWTYLLLLVGVILSMRFGGMGCGLGGRRARPAHGPDHPGAADTPVESAPPTDPVSRRTVDPKTAVATIYQGRAYYFESRENRDRFEAAPDPSPPVRETMERPQRTSTTQAAEPLDRLLVGRGINKQRATP